MITRRLALPALLVVLSFAYSFANEAQQSETRTGIFRGMKVTYTWVPSKQNDGTGKAIFQGDVILDHVQQLPENGRPQPRSVGVAYAQYLWPKVSGVSQIPYKIDPSSGDTSNLSTALSQFNSDFMGLIQFVAYTNQTDYVNFYFDPNNTSGVCEAYEGRVGGEQTVGGSASCTVATILHEMGHTVGVWHEQTRDDRNTYVNVNYGAVIKASRSFFDQAPDNHQDLTLFDFASVMEYPAYSFSRNGEPCIESIPAGIPLSNSTGYTASDIDGIMRLYGEIPTSVTVTSNPPGLQVLVDGNSVMTPQVYSWALNSTHTLAVATAPQTLNGINYVYGRWNDSTVQSHTITVTPGDNTVTQPATAPAVTVYSANFIQLVPYANVISPMGAGTVTPSPSPVTYSPLSGQYYIIRQQVALTAAPAPSSGQNFYNFINSPYYLPGGTGANPKMFYVMDDGSAINLTTYFTTSPVYTVTTNPIASNVGTLVDGSWWYAPKNFALPYDSSWTASSSHALNVDSPQYPWSSNTRFAFSSWSDAGAQSHNVTLPASGGATYTANLTPQYYVTDYANESCAGSIGVSPSSPTGDGFYPTGDLLTFSETANTGWTFTEWLYDLSGTTSPQNFIVSDEVLVVADYSTASTPLHLNSISPPNATAGGPGFTLTINGAGFTSSTAAYIGGFYREATFVNSGQVTVPILASDIATAGAFQVAVGNFPSGASCAAYVPTTFYVLLPSGATAAVSPSSIGFGKVAAGTTSSTKSITLSNNGTAALSIVSIAASGDFSQTNNCGNSLTAGNSCAVNVTFSPTVAGAITGALTFADGVSTSPQIVTLTGTGENPLTFAPASLSLGSVAVGKTAAKTVTVTNNQASAISLSPSTSADYSITGGTCGASLAAAAKCTIIVVFAPASSGITGGGLAIATNGALSPQIVALTGTATGGPTAALTFSPTTLSFAATAIGITSAAKTITVTNSSSASVSITAITTSAAFSAAGSGSTPCGGALAPSAKCTIAVTFIPHNTGSTKGALAIATSGAGSPQIIDVSGTGKLPVTVAPTSIAFGDQSMGTTSAAKTVMLTNNSEAELTISDILASGDFAAIPSGSKACGTTLAAAGKCTFSVTFTPNATGTITGAATVIHNAPHGPAVIKLTGTGQ